jgi:hypothetical protein
MMSELDLTYTHEQSPEEVSETEFIDYDEFGAERLWKNARVAAVVLVVLVTMLLPVLTRGCGVEVTILAWLNCTVYMFFAMHFLRQRTLGCLIPVITPILMIAGSCLGVLYFAIFQPDATYSTLLETLSFLSGGAKFQLTILVFMLSYLIPLVYLLKPERLVVQSPQFCTRYIAHWTIIVYGLAMTLSVLVQFFTVPGIIKWFGDGLLLYCNGFMFVAGSLYKLLSKKFKIIMFSIMAAIFVLFTLANSRGKAIAPIMFLVLGYTLFCDAKLKSKIMLVGIFAAALPVYIIIGNTTRELLGTVGFEELTTRIAAMREWRYAAEKARNPMTQMFGRFFFSGGNVIVMSTPSQHPYLDFSLGRFTLETLESLLPGALIYHPYYRGTVILTEYGLNVTEKTSIEVSIIGNLWLLGGYVPVIIGGFAVALLHSFVAWRIRRTWVRDPDKAMFYFIVFVQAFLNNFQLDFISNFRHMMWRLAFAFVAFKIISPFLKVSYRHAVQMEVAIEGPT